MTRPATKTAVKRASKKSVATARKSAAPRKAAAEPYPGDLADDLDDAAPPSQVRLAPIRMITAHVPIVGETPLIPHKWSEKARRMMFDKQSGNVTRQPREPKDPQKDARDATYWLPDGNPGMPATAFKAAIVEGVRLFDGLTMTAARQWVRVNGIPDVEGTVLVPIKGKRTMREDTPRNASGVADLRYRYMFWPWSAVLEVVFPERYIDVDSIVRLVNGGGLAGVGDWRPSSPRSKTGTFGCFVVDVTKNIRLERRER